MSISSFMIKGMNKIIETGKVKVSENSERFEPEGEAKLGFIALGDPQISFISPLRSARVYSACQDLKRINGNFDALVLLGDLAEYGMSAEYRVLASLINSVMASFDKFYSVSGNHDVRLRRYKKQILKFRSFLSLVDKSVLNPKEHYYFSDIINGYKFIFLGADKTCFEASYISEKQLKWLENELKSEDDKPVFVFNHQPLKNTNGLPDSWLGKGDRRGSVGNESDRLREVLNSRKNVFYITGHLHYGMSEYNFDDLGNIKAISVPTVGVLNHGEYDEPEQGLVFSVFEDKVVCKARLLGKGKYVPKEIKNSEFSVVL